MWETGSWWALTPKATLLSSTAPSLVWSLNSQCRGRQCIRQPSVMGRWFVLSEWPLETFLHLEPCCGPWQVVPGKLNVLDPTNGHGSHGSLSDSWHSTSFLKPAVRKFAPTQSYIPEFPVAWRSNLNEGLGTRPLGFPVQISCCQGHLGSVKSHWQMQIQLLNFTASQ